MSVFEFRIDTILKKEFQVLDMKQHTVRGEVEVPSENKTEISMAHNIQILRLSLLKGNDHTLK